MRISTGSHDDRRTGEGWGGRGRGGGNRDRNYDTRNAGGGSGGDRWQRGNGQKRRGRGRGRGGGGGPSPISRLQDEDGDVTMEREGSGSSRSDRFNPYGRRDRDRSGFNRQKNRDSRGTAQGRGAQEMFTRAIGSLDTTGGRKNNRNGSRNDRRPRDKTREPSETWFKITIPYGNRHDKEWLLTAIRNVCTVPFQEVDYNCVQNASHFYVDDEATANALKSVSKRITARSGHKVVIHISRSKPPRNQPVLNENSVQVLKEVMSKRYDPSKKLLSLNNMFHDPDLKANDIQAALNKPAIMSEVVKIIEENIPEISALNLSENRLYGLQTLTTLVSKATDLKYLDLSDNNLKSYLDLDSIKGFKLEELLLRNNPFTTGQNDSAEYISAVRKRFPKLLKLDGKDMPAPISFGIEEITALPPIQKSFFASDEIERVLSKFIDNYYSVFDSTDRQSLFNAYHEQARFSLTAAASPNTPHQTKNILSQYIRESRNLLKVSDGSSRQRLMKQGRLATVAFLNELPQMQHDTLSFQIDVSLAEMSTNTKILAFTVHGVFKNVEHKSLDQPLIAFSRFFITVVDPATGGLLIVNDELCVRPPTSNQKRAAFSSVAPTPSSSPVTVQPGSSSVVQVGLSADQQAMVQQFVLDSDMNAEWSMKCLQENNWNYSAAGDVFMQLKKEGKIPPEAFVK